MGTRKMILLLTGYFCLSYMFLMGLEGCGFSSLTSQRYIWPPCSDQDEDGYGSPASASCTFPELDCNDNSSDIYPNAPELCDKRDNQCSGNTGFGEIDEGCNKEDTPSAM